MYFNSPTLYIELIVLSIISLSLINFLLKKRKMSAERIYKLIDKLEKKYIH